MKYIPSSKEGNFSLNVVLSLNIYMSPHFPIFIVILFLGENITSDKNSSYFMTYYETSSANKFRKSKNLQT